MLWSTDTLGLGQGLLFREEGSKDVSWALQTQL